METATKLMGDRHANHRPTRVRRVGNQGVASHQDTRNTVNQEKGTKCQG